MRLVSHHISNFSNKFKIDEEQRKFISNASEKLEQEYITARDTACTLSEVYEALIARGLSEGSLRHEISDFSEKLEVTIDDLVCNLAIQLFPKRKVGKVSLSCSRIWLYYDFAQKSSPESIADYIIAIPALMQEYQSIEEHIIAADNQRKIACNIAMDLVNKTIGEKLAAKGYQYDVTYWDGSNEASLRITFDRAFSMTFEINLLEDFLDSLTCIIDSLPLHRHS